MLQTPTAESRERRQAERTVAVPTPGMGLQPSAGISSLRASGFPAGQLGPDLAASQRGIGNRAMLRKLNRPTVLLNQPGNPLDREADQAAGPGSTMQDARQQAPAAPLNHALRSASGPSHFTGVQSSNQAVLRRLAATAQPMQCKLQAGSVNDPLEAEADRVADRVMRMPDPEVAIRTAAPQISRKCAGCEEEEEGKLQRKPAAGARSAGDAPPLVHEVLRSPGRSLDPGTRAFMEPRFGADFGEVRVHDGAQATESAKSVNALAYTVGNNVVFNRNQYQPGSIAGQRLLAHELTHVVQQSGEGALRLRRKELPDEETPKDWPVPSQFNEGHEECRWEEGDLKCYKVKCVQKEENKTHCFYDSPDTPEPDKPAAPPQAQAAKKAVVGKNSKGQDYVIYEKEIRVGGTRPWRNNNPGNFDKPEDHPNNIGNDGRFLIFPDAATGKQELFDSVKSHGTSTIRDFITTHAPPKENDTEKYIREVVGYLNNGDKIGDCQINRPSKPVSDSTILGNLSEAEQTSFANAMAREEGWCDVTHKKTIYNCQSASIPDEYKGKLVCP
jgi:hypothetical protein